MTLHDEIWQRVPEERPVDRHALEFALATIGVDGSPSSGSAVLDLGCGDGRLAAELARSGARVTGVDRSRTALERAARAHPELELAAPIADGTLPLSDCSFQAVICVHVLEHVADTQLLLSEARRVLAPGGSLVVAVPWHGRLRNVLIALGSYERHYDPLEPVLRFYSPKSLRRLLECFGFEDIGVRAAGGVPLLRETLLAAARRGSIGSGLPPGSHPVAE